MNVVLDQIYWLRDNYVDVLVSMSILMIALQGFVRLTPTKADDSFLERVNKYLDWLMNTLKIPNVKREDGSIMPAGKHEPKPEEKKAA